MGGVTTAPDGWRIASKEELVGWRGLEPRTNALKGHRAIHGMLVFIVFINFFIENCL